jgi:hypothetical protein
MKRIVVGSLRGAAAVAFGLALACSSGPGTPVGFSVIAPDFDILQLRWSPPSGGADSYDLEGRVGSEPWEAVERGIPGDAIGGTIGLEPATPELLTFGFRLRAVKHGKHSGWAETTYLRGVRPPMMVGANIAKSGDGFTRIGPITVAWTNRSSVATEVQLERAPATAAPVFLPLPVTHGALSYVDDDAAEMTTYQYRARYGTAGIWSEWATLTLSEMIDLLPAKGLTVSSLAGGGVRVSWTPRSARANRQALLRWKAFPGYGEPLPALSPTASEYEDPLDSQWPVLRYQVVTDRSDYPPATVWSEVAVVRPFTLSGPPVLGASSISLRAGESFVRDGVGRFHVGSQGYSQPFVSRATASGSEERVLSGFVFNQGPPRLGVDADDHVHVVYGRAGAQPTDPPILTHEWHDGTSWVSEDVPGPFPAGIYSYWAAVAAGTGAIHVVLPSVEGLLLHAVKESGAWTTASLPATQAAALQQSFGVAPDGTAYEVVAGTTNSVSDCRLRVRPPGGSWGDEEIIPACLRPTSVWLLPANEGRAAVVIGVDGPDVISTDLLLVRRQAAGGFSPVELIVNRPFNGSTFEVWGASSADASRAAIAVDVSDDLNTSARSRLLLRDSGAAASWREVTPGPGTARSWVLGFDAEDKVWVLGNFSWLDLGLVPYAVLEEQ